MARDQSASNSTPSSPAERSPNTSSAPNPPVSKAPTSPATPKLPASSPVEPSPELELDHESDFEDRSPTFAHEADTHPAPEALNLPSPAVDRTQYSANGPVMRARVSWTQGKRQTDDENGEMREATERALENARKMFGKDFGRNSGDGGASKDYNGKAR